jgi:branched-subunit amino acid transport protein
MRESTLVLTLGMALVTFLPRFLPMAFLSRWILPEKLKAGLNYFPVAILSAIVFPTFFTDGNQVEIQFQYLLAALPVFIFAWKVKSLWGSVVLGMAVYWLLGFVLLSKGYLCALCSLLYASLGFWAMRLAIALFFPPSLKIPSR